MISDEELAVLEAQLSLWEEERSRLQDQEVQLVDDSESLSDEMESLDEFVKETIEENSNKKTEKEDVEETIAEIAENVFPENSFYTTNRETFVSSINCESIPYSHSYLIIRFPEFNIKNRNKRSHKIKNLFVVCCFNICNEGKISMNNQIYGNRSEYTSAEFKSKYRHSHLSTSGFKKFTYFCLGEGTSMSTALAELNMNFCPERFELFLHLLNSYVRYESLEGGPFIKMERITLESSTTEPTVDVDVERIEYLSLISEDLDNDLPIYFDSFKNRYAFNCCDESYLKALGSITVNPYVKNSSGGYTRYSSSDGALLTESEKSRERKPMLLFRNETIYSEVIDEVDKEKENVVEVTKYPKPEIAKRIGKDIARDVNLYYFKKETYEKQY